MEEMWFFLWRPRLRCSRGFAPLRRLHPLLQRRMARAAGRRGLVLSISGESVSGKSISRESISAFALYNVFQYCKGIIVIKSTHKFVIMMVTPQKAVGVIRVHHSAAATNLARNVGNNGFNGVSHDDDQIVDTK